MKGCLRCLRLVLSSSRSTVLPWLENFWSRVHFTLPLTSHCTLALSHPHSCIVSQVRSGLRSPLLARYLHLCTVKYLTDVHFHYNSCFISLCFFFFSQMPCLLLYKVKIVTWKENEVHIKTSFGNCELCMFAPCLESLRVWGRQQLVT